MEREKVRERNGAKWEEQIVLPTAATVSRTTAEAMLLFPAKQMIVTVHCHSIAPYGLDNIVIYQKQMCQIKRKCLYTNRR